MAISTTNSLTLHYSGKFNNFVYRMWNGASILQKLPDFSNYRWSKAQKANRKRFSEAMAYARKVMSDPEKRAFYERKAKSRQNAWNVAVSDYMRRPEVCLIDTSEYQGKKGGEIRVKGNDKYGIAGVIVYILDAQGLEVESGLAVDTGNNSEFIYPACEENPRRMDGKVVVCVTDYPGNIVRAEKFIRNR